MVSWVTRRPADIPKHLPISDREKYLGRLIPFSVALFIVLAIIFGLVLHRTTFGRYLYSIGNNENATAYSGVPVAKIKFIIYTLSGFMAALAGLILAARFGSTRPDIGTGLELAVITAAVLGGVDINGGKGTMVGRRPVITLDWPDALWDGVAQYPGSGAGDRDWHVIDPFHSCSQPCSRCFRLCVGISTGVQCCRLSAVLLIFILFFAFFFWSRAAVIAGV